MEDALFVNSVALLFLTAMEIVLGIDNIVFIAIVTQRLPEQQQPGARRLGLFLALIMRILLLWVLSQILSLDTPFFTLSSLGFMTEWLTTHEHINEVSVRDLILIGGGLFLIGKSVFEIHEQLEDHQDSHRKSKTVSFTGVLIQIAVLDIVFSLDSVITAVGMAKDIRVMVTAIIIAIGVMMIFSEKISAFVHRHPTLKMLALSFLILIGVLLLAEGVGTELDRGYIYFAMAFALLVEMLNMRVRPVAAASQSA